MNKVYPKLTIDIIATKSQSELLDCSEGQRVSVTIACSMAGNPILNPKTGGLMSTGYTYKEVIKGKLKDFDVSKFALLDETFVLAS